MRFAMSPEPVAPWKAFLEDLDSLLAEAVQLHCIGGFAVVAAYGLLRSTNDLDYFSIQPYDCAAQIETTAGRGSSLAQKHKMYVQRVGVASVPESYDERLTELYPGHFANLRLFVPDPYDLALSKLTRNAERDREDVRHLAKTCSLDPDVLRDRYQKEMRSIVIGNPLQHDATLEFWIEAYFSER
jgi:hypothetical protein